MSPPYPFTVGPVMPPNPEPDYTRFYVTIDIHWTESWTKSLNNPYRNAREYLIAILNQACPTPAFGIIRKVEVDESNIDMSITPPSEDNTMSDITRFFINTDNYCIYEKISENRVRIYTYLDPHYTQCHTKTENIEQLEFICEALNNEFNNRWNETESILNDPSTMNAIEEGEFEDLR